MRLKDKVAIVTGAGQGLGEAIALRLAREKCKVAAVDINFSAAKKTAQKIEEIKGDSLPLEVDVTKSNQVKSMVKETVEEFGRLDINVVVFLASDEASYMTGQAINVTGGEEMK